MSNLALAKTYVPSVEALAAQTKAYTTLIDISKAHPDTAEAIKTILTHLQRDMNSLAIEMSEAE